MFVLSDPRLAKIPIRDSGEPLVDVQASAPLRVAGRTFLRSGLVDRLVTAQSLLPREVRLLVVNGYRPPGRAVRAPRLRRRAGPSVHRGPHGVRRPTGGRSTPDRRSGRPHPRRRERTRAAPGVLPRPDTAAPDETRQLLTSALAAAGLVNYPARWWHWSYGDRFWASVTEAPHAGYGASFPEDVRQTL